MAPRKKPAARKGKDDTQDILDSLKSNVGSLAQIQLPHPHLPLTHHQLNKAKTKIGTLKAQARTRITKSNSLSKERKARTSHLQKVAEQVPIENIPSAPNVTTPPPILRTPAPLTIHAFEIGRPLGRGKFGRVYLARHRESNYICALKVLSKSQITGASEERLIRRELEVHQNLHHPNILKLLSWFHDETRIFLVLEYAPGGNLYEELGQQKGGRFKEAMAARYVAQVAEALRYLHGKGVLHRGTSYLLPLFQFLIIPLFQFPIY